MRMHRLLGFGVFMIIVISLKSEMLLVNGGINLRIGSVLAESGGMNDLEVVEGYLQLEMAEDAMTELRDISSGEHVTERYQELLLATEMMLQRWGEAAETAKGLCVMNASEKSYFIHAAFCLHEVGETEEALRQLLSGPGALLSDALYYYNLACYNAVLGNLTDARHCLDKSFELDPELEVTSRDDDDLRGLFVFEGDGFFPE